MQQKLSDNETYLRRQPNERLVAELAHARSGKESQEWLATVEAEVRRRGLEK